MQVAKWGDDLAVRIPDSLVLALDLKEGEEVNLHPVGDKNFELSKRAPSTDLLIRLREMRGRLPDNFHFDRLAANEAR